MTGVHVQFSQLVGKRLALLLEVVPQAARIAVLVNPAHPADAEASARNATEAAGALGLDIKVFNATTTDEINETFAELVLWRAGAVLVAPDIFLSRQRALLVTLAAQYMLPTSGFNRTFIEAGGLMSYGPDNSDNYRLAGRYVGRILKCEKPTDLPVLQPTKFELIINLKVAKALGITFPPSILLSADEVIE